MDIRVMAFSLRDIADSIGKIESLAKIAKAKYFFQMAILIETPPGAEIAKQRIGFLIPEWGRIPFAGDTFSIRKFA